MTAKNIFRVVCMLLLGIVPVTTNAQIDANEEEPDTVQQPVKVRKVKPLPTYEMREVCGLVIDAATHQPIDGARVQAYSDSHYSVLTSEDGTYWLKVPVFVNSLYVTVPGYNDVQVAFGEEQRIPTVEMYSSAFNSYYHPTIGITSNRKVDIDMSSAVSIDEEIEKKLGGDIHTINRTGIRGQGVAMFIRGLNSLNLNSQPLIVLDGMFMDLQLDRESIHDGFFNNILAGIDPEDIESVEVLKNATALYGARGANGVVLINTKRGKSMATKINASIYGGFETKPSYIKMMNGSQYKNYVSDLIGTTEYGLKNSSYTSTIPFLNANPSYYWYPMYNNNTDWSEGLYHAAFSQNYKVNVQGGDDIAMYNLALGYTNAQSTAKENDFSRLNIRFNTDIKLFKGLTSQLDISYSRINYDLRDNGWAESYNSSSISSPNVLGLIQAPFLSKYGYYTGEDLQLHQSTVYAGKYIDDNYPFDFASKYGNNAALANPYWILKNGDGNNKNNQQVTQFNLNVMPRWEINRHLSISNRFAYQLNRSNEKYFLPKAGSPIYNLEGLGDITSIVKSFFGKETSVFNDFRVNWANRYGAHQVNVFGGFRYTNNSYQGNYMTGYNAGNDKMPDFKNSLDFRTKEGSNDTWRNIAYYAHADYNYKNTYFADFTLSAEASSRFGHETSEGVKFFGVKWGVFPSLQLGWVLSNESWMGKLKGVNHLKLTLGYDESGNDAIPYSASRTYFQSTPFLKTAIGLQLVNIENPSIQWETTRRLNAGLNGSFFNNRIQAGVDFYISSTSNLLTLKENNYLTGLSAYWTNDGSLRNVGADIHVNAIIFNGKDFKWELGASMGHYKNTIKDLPSGDYTNKIYGGEVLTAEGKPAGVFFGYKTDGVFSSDVEASQAYKGNDYLKYPTGIKADPYKNFSAGDVHFVDMTDDGVIDSKDKTIIGDPNPDVYGNIFSTFTYKRWTLGITFKYSLGNDIYNYQRSQLEASSNYYNQTLAVVNRWKNEGQHTDMPRAVYPTSEEWVNNERFSDRWIEDGSYLKLKTVRLSYNWPLNLSWIQGMTIWAEANNIFTLTNYTGNDPEFSCGNSILYQGIDAGLLPSSRSFYIGLKLNL